MKKSTMSAVAAVCVAGALAVSLGAVSDWYTNWDTSTWFGRGGGNSTVQPDDPNKPGVGYDTGHDGAIITRWIGRSRSSSPTANGQRARPLRTMSPSRPLSTARLPQQSSASKRSANRSSLPAKPAAMPPSPRPVPSTIRKSFSARSLFLQVFPLTAVRRTRLRKARALLLCVALARLILPRI